MHLTALNTFWKAMVTEKAGIGTELESKRLLDLVHGGLQDTRCIFTEMHRPSLPSAHTSELNLNSILSRHSAWGTRTNLVDTRFGAGLLFLVQEEETGSHASRLVMICNEQGGSCLRPHHLGDTLDLI